MNYLLEYLKDGAKFEAIMEGKTVLEHYIGSVTSFDKTIITTKIMSENKEYELVKDSVVELMVYTPKGVYSIEAKVLEKLENGWELSFPMAARLSQRREYLRVEVKTEIKIKLNKDNEEQEIIGMTRDVCAGGVAFDCAHLIPEGEIIEIEFELDDAIIKSKGKIAYSIPMGNNTNRAGVIMTTLAPDDAFHIIDFCSEYIGMI